MSTETYTPSNLLAGGWPCIMGTATLASGAGSLAAGSVLGRILRSAAAAEAGYDNSGNGTVSTPTLLAGSQVGDYIFTCTGGTLTATVTQVGGSAGELTMDVTTPVLTGATAGDYQVVCVDEYENAGEFLVFDPYGDMIGTYTVGDTFATEIKFSIADGATDFAANDTFVVTVAESVPANGLATFSVEAPDGTALPDLNVGTAYATQIGLTISDGTINFAIDDTFTVTVSAVLGNYKLSDSTAGDGSEDPDCILADATDATSAAKPCSVYLEGCFNEDALTFGGTDTADTHRTAMRAKGLHLTTVTVA